MQFDVHYKQTISAAVVGRAADADFGNWKLERLISQV